MCRPLFVLAVAFAAFPAPGTARAQCEVQELATGDGLPLGYFGFSIALSGDVGLIGTLQDDPAGLGFGAVYVTEREAGMWQRKARLEASDAAPGDWFGYSAAIEGDVAVIGAVYADARAVDSGAAYVFERQAGAWVETAKLTAPDGAFEDLLGYKVALSQGTILVTSYYDDDKGEQSGSVYVFERHGAAWTQTAKLTASDGEQVDFFGSALSIDGATAMVGAFADDDAAHDSGSAYVFERVGGAWVETAKLAPPDAAAGDAFGVAVAVAGDTALISSLRDDDSWPNSGSVYAYELQGGAWTLTDKFQPEESAAGDEFGLWISISGDTALIASMFDDAFTGSAYLYRKQATGWVEAGKLTDADAVPGDRFACSIALSRDTAFVGTLEGDGAVADSGTAHVFSIAALCGAALPYGCGVNPQGSLTASAPPALGATIALSVGDPSGAQPADAAAFLAVSTTPDAAFPCGTLVPGFGAGGAGDGELLLSLAPAPFLVLSGGAWSGAAVPFALPVPAAPILAGASVFAQGLLVAPGGGPSGAATLTNAVELLLGF
jgi:hypothetical protein